MLIQASAMRQTVAINLFLLAIPYIYNKDPVRYALCIGIAYFFHSSALILLPLFFLSYINWTINKISGSIKIEGVKRWGANIYLPGYYKMKKKLNLPVFIKTLAKKAYPFYKNYKDSKQPIVFETILNTFKP